MNVEILSWEEATFRVRPSCEPGRLTLKLEGEGNLEAVEAVHRVLKNAHAEAQRLGVKVIVVDFTGLEFLSSTGLKHFVSWLRDASRLPPSTAYSIRMVSNPRLAWQRRSCEALKAFAPNMVSIDTHET